MLRVPDAEAAEHILLRGLCESIFKSLTFSKSLDPDRSIVIGLTVQMPDVETGEPGTYTSKTSIPTSLLLRGAGILVWQQFDLLFEHEALEGVIANDAFAGPRQPHEKPYKVS